MADRLDILNGTAAHSQALMSSGRLTACDLVKASFEQIIRHNNNGMNLRAVIDAAPLESALNQGEVLDAERSTKGARSPLHGIPVLAKASLSVRTPP